MNEIGPPGATAIPPEPKQASPVSSAPDFAPARRAPRATARDVLVQVFYHRKLLRGCVLFGLFADC